MINKSVQSFIHDGSDTVTDFTVDGNCSKCGECCKDIITADFNEIRKIKKYVQQHKIQPQWHPTGRKSIDMTCPFLNWDTRECVIYPVRPKICREFLCSKSNDELTAIREKIASQGTVMSLRKEVFDDDSQIRMAAMAITAQTGFQFNGDADKGKK